MPDKLRTVCVGIRLNSKQTGLLYVERPPFPMPLPSHPTPAHPIPYHNISSHIIPQHPVPYHPILSHPMPSHPIGSHPVHPIPPPLISSCAVLRLQSGRRQADDRLLHVGGREGRLRGVGRILVRRPRRRLQRFRCVSLSIGTICYFSSLLFFTVGDYI